MQAIELHQQGNTFYSSGRNVEARECYKQAIDLIEKNGNYTRENSTLIAQLYSNRAQTFIQERDFVLALNDTQRALEWDSQNEKAILRQLVALEHLERFESALKLVQHVLESSVHSTHTVNKAISTRRRLQKLLQQDHIVAKRESAAVGRMVHANQQLRVNFGSLIPSSIQINEFFSVSINIGNEFGLFCRDYMPANCADLMLQCSLRSSSPLSSSFQLIFRDTDHKEGLVRLNDRGKAVVDVAVNYNGSQECVRNVPSERLALSVAVHPQSAKHWNLLPVVSLPFMVTKGTTPSPSDSLDEASLGVHCCRTVILPSITNNEPMEVLLAESPGNLGIGGKLWDSCLVLSEYLSKHHDTLIHNKKIIELGSGLGLVGIYCAKIGGMVTLTDIPDVVPLLDYNINLNFNANTFKPTAVAHWWGSRVDNLPSTPDVVVMSDVVYDPEGYVPLIQSLKSLANNPYTVVLMAHRTRNPMEHQFFELLQQDFEYEQVNTTTTRQDLPECANVTSCTQPLEKNKQILQDVKIFRITRRNSTQI